MGQLDKPKQKPAPNYLKDYADLWAVDPHAANLEWFKNAKLGLFIHYGLYSQLGQGEWVQFHKQIPVKEYGKLKDNFTAHRFDADYITDLALEAEMKYINLVTCHHESFCLWDSTVESFNSVKSPCGRDLVGELAEACNKKGLGFFTYYTFMANWRHPWFLSRDVLPIGRPDYKESQPEYLFKQKEDFVKYLAYIDQCMGELLTGYGPIAGMWLDIIVAWFYLGPEYIPIEDIYASIRKKQPHTLISWKQGATGEEDFCSPEQHFHSMEEKARQCGGETAAMRARIAWEKNTKKHNEICATLQRGGWGFNAFSPHRSEEETYALLGHALGNNCNLLLNIGPLSDGSVHPTQVKLLKALGKQIRRDGFPKDGVVSNKNDETIPEL